MAIVKWRANSRVAPDQFRALQTVTTILTPTPGKKALIYFSSGVPRTGAYDPAELKAAIDAAVRANIVIYPVDSSGLPH
jgi:hypothetical protein